MGRQPCGGKGGNLLVGQGGTDLAGMTAGTAILEIGHHHRVPSHHAIGIASLPRFGTGQFQQGQFAATRIDGVGQDAVIARMGRQRHQPRRQEAGAGRCQPQDAFPPSQ